MLIYFIDMLQSVLKHINLYQYTEKENIKD